MDFESEKKIYNIIVRASSLPLRNDVDVEIHVTGTYIHAQHFSWSLHTFAIFIIEQSHLVCW